MAIDNRNPNDKRNPNEKHDPNAPRNPNQGQQTSGTYGQDRMSEAGKKSGEQNPQHGSGQHGGGMKR